MSVTPPLAVTYRGVQVVVLLHREGQPDVEMVLNHEASGVTGMAVPPECGPAERRLITGEVAGILRGVVGQLEQQAADPASWA